MVTGASSGIGEAIAQRLHGAGCHVYGTSRRGGMSLGNAYAMLPLDVTSDDSVAAAVREVIQLEGRIDLLVNNAGFGTAAGGAEESSIEQAEAIFETNFFGVVRMIRAVVPHMRRQGSGRIINISSVFGFLPMPYGALYSASKHALEGYSESLDHELRRLGIRVSTITPAYTRTQFESNSIALDAPMAEYRRVRAHVDTVTKEHFRNADDPVIVADAVLQAVTAEQPKLRYTAGSKARSLSLLRSFAPASAVDTGIRKNLRLHLLPRE